MSKRFLWSDDYWLLLLQLYLKKPMGVKPLYSRQLVNLSMELHIPPQMLYEQMFRLRQLETPRLQHLWEEYAENPKKLARGVKLLRRMYGFGQANRFYDGVEVAESFELDFKPLTEDHELTPMMLIIILDLYYHLIPITMVPETPEIINLGKLMNIAPRKIVEVMEIFRFCDPYLNRDDIMIHPLLVPCQEVWKRYGNANPEQLAALTAQLKEYFAN